ncbi:MAG: hydrogenase maturation nickel metallochaperone HypA [Spirochaetales bacterium]|jgi:hydrogenase nickel incorporation protein HypA/HybF|nr:hydrogenase maturation nickel metallochaperone HypA [Spirochaetales bacterium]
MHELGVVFHCIKEVNEIAAENKVARVNCVTIQLGEVSTVIPHLFEDCWNWAVKKETVLKDCRVKIETIPAVTFCEDCKKEYPTVQYGKTCPYCGGGNTYLVQGNEFMIKEIEVVDGTPGSVQT